jgi:hypothetical protein
MEFVGHGALGISRVASWASYFAVIGLSQKTAFALMPIIGCMDIAFGIAVLIQPARSLLLYLAVWGLWTALLRPLAGESVWEAVERAGNFGAALALYLMASPQGSRSWIRRPSFATLSEVSLNQVRWTLRLTTSALLLGHGLLGLSVHKAMLGNQYAAVGIHTPWFESAVGALECGFALAVLIRPAFGLLLFVVAWKLSTEALAPLSGTPIWVFLEHGGSYAAPLALALILRNQAALAPLPFRASPA